MIIKQYGYFFNENYYTITPHEKIYVYHHLRIVYSVM